MADDPPDDSGFLSRWSRRKALVRQGEVPAEPVAAPRPVASVQPAADAAVVTEPLASPPPPAAPAPPPPPTLADVAGLTRDSDYSRFVAPGVDSTVKNAALKQLFTDPHFNVMDGLDIYIDDYGIPDPLPAGMLQKMAQSQFLGLFTAEPADADAEAAAAEAAAAADVAQVIPASQAAPDTLPPAQATPDEDAALRLQPHPAAGPPGAGQGPGPDPGRQC